MPGIDDPGRVLIDTQVLLWWLAGDRAGSFGHAHRDPFDRILAAQSIIEDLPLVSADAALDAFGIQRIR